MKQFSIYLELIKSIYRSDVDRCKVNSKDDLFLDYIYCLNYQEDPNVHTDFQSLEVTDTTISCNLKKRQRSCQQILDFADFLQHYRFPIRKLNYGESFSSQKPLWVELSNHKLYFDFFKYLKFILEEKGLPKKERLNPKFNILSKFKSNDVMLIWDENTYMHMDASNFSDIEEFCRKQKWRFTEKSDVRGSEASVTILYDLDVFQYEFLTRAKALLVLVTIDGKQR